MGSLTKNQAIEALEAPASDEGVRWAPDALERVLEVTECFPYFLQEFGKAAWDAAEGPAQIPPADVGSGVCRWQSPPSTTVSSECVRDLTSDSERAYLRAMATHSYRAYEPLEPSLLHAQSSRLPTAVGPTLSTLGPPELYRSRSTW